MKQEPIYTRTQLSLAEENLLMKVDELTEAKKEVDKITAGFYLERCENIGCENVGYSAEAEGGIMVHLFNRDNNCYYVFCGVCLHIELTLKPLNEKPFPNTSRFYDENIARNAILNFRKLKELEDRK